MNCSDPPGTLGDSRSEIKEEGRGPGGHSRRESPDGPGQRTSNGCTKQSTNLCFCTQATSRSADQKRY